MKKIPRNVRQAFHIICASEDGIFQLTDEKGRSIYDRCYRFSDINYINRDDDDKKAVLMQMMKFLNSMSVDFKITVANEYRDHAEFVKQIFSVKNRDKYPSIEEGMKEWVNEKSRQADIADVEKVLYLTVMSRFTGREEAAVYFHSLDTQLMRLFLGMQSSIHPVDGQSRVDMLRRFFHPGETDPDEETDDEEGQDNEIADEPEGQDIRINRRGKYSRYNVLNDVYPSSIETFRNFLILGDDLYVSVLFARDYAATLDEGKVIHGFSVLPYQLLITMDYAPVEKQVLKGKLSEAHMNNEKAIAQEIDDKRNKGQYASGISYSKEKKKEELEAYQDQIDDNDESGFLMGLLIVVTAPSEDELANRISAVRHIGKENGIVLDTYNFLQLKALNTALPVGVRMVDHMRAFLTSSAVALQPFYADDLQELGGTLYGLNRTTNHLVFGNRKKLSSPHGIIVGHTGGGKSFLIKETEIAQTLLSTDDDITAIDPQNELEGICKEYGGRFIDLTPKSSIHINPLEIPSDLNRSSSPIRVQQFVADQTEWAASFCCAAMKNMIFTQEHRSAIGRCIRSMYEAAFEDRRKKIQPTLCDFREEICREMENAGNDRDRDNLRAIYNALEEYTNGAYDMFAHESNLHLNSRFVVFGLARVAEDLWEPVMITIMHWLSNRMEYNQSVRKATRLIVDEAQVVCRQKSSADMLLHAVVTYRKFGGIVTMCLQNLTRVLENPELRDMMSNCGYKCFLNQSGMDAQSLTAIQKLSQTEFESLSEEVPGYGVMIWGQKVILLGSRMDKDNVLYDRFSTNFHEKARRPAGK